MHSPHFSILMAQGDVTDRTAMRTLVTDADTKQPLDLVVANAGVQAEILGDADPLVQSGPSIFDVNCNGVFNTVDPAIERFRERGAGHIAIMASIASYMPGISPSLPPSLPPPPSLPLSPSLPPSL